MIQLCKLNKDKLSDILACTLFIVLFLVMYNDVLLFNEPFMAVNTTVPTSDLNYYFVGLSSNWWPGHLGLPNPGAGLSNVLFLSLELVSGMNTILVEKLLLSYMLVAAFSMYYFLGNHFKFSRPARFVAALIFAFGPSTVWDFTDFLLWGYAVLPIVFNYMFNLFDNEQLRIRDIVIFSMSLAFAIEFTPQILPVFLLSFFIFLLTRLFASSEKMKFLGTALKRFVPSSLIFLALSFQTVLGLVVFVLPSGGFVPAGDVTFYYSDLSFLNAFRIIGGDFLSMTYQYPNPIGFALPILAFSSLLFVKKNRKYLNLIAFSILIVILIWIAYSLKEGLPWVVWFNEHTPFLKPLMAAQRLLYLITFSYSCMIGVAAHEMIKGIQSIRFPKLKNKGMRLLKFKNGAVVAIVSALILSANFVYSPHFDSNMHEYLYYPLPSSHATIDSWLESQNESEFFRVLLLPATPDYAPRLNQLSKGSLGIGQSIAVSYVDFVYTAFVEGSTDNIGSLLASAGVKYVIVNLESPEYGRFNDLITLWSRKGEIREEVDILLGDPSNFVTFLDKQQDLERIVTDDKFVVYINKMFVPHLSVYQNATFVFGSMDSILMLGELLGFEINHTLPVLVYQNALDTINLSKAFPTLYFSNTDLKELTALFSLPKYGINPSMAGLQQGWTLLASNSSLFSYGDSYIMTSIPRSLELNFTAEASSAYHVWIRVLFAPQASMLKVEADNHTMSQLQCSAPNSMFQWVDAGSINLVAGDHTLNFTSYGFNAVDYIVVVPSSVMQDFTAQAMDITSEAQTLFLLDFQKSAMNVTMPSGEYRIALKNPAPVVVSPEMGVIDFDSTQKFVLSKDNFKPAHNPPHWDFDNANYYFYTKNGDYIDVEFNGSASAYISIAYNVTDISQWHAENQVLLLEPQVVDNQTFRFEIPANSVFQPVINAYNPDMNQNTSDTLTEIILKHAVDSVSPVLSVDDINVTGPGILIENESWIQYGPVNLTSGEHQVTLFQPFQANQPIAIYNFSNLTSALVQNANINYKKEMESWTKYYVDVNTDRPLFLSLAESYHQNWVAYTDDGQQLDHFVASMYTNGFILNGTNSNSVRVTIEFEPIWQNQINSIQELSWIMAAVFLFSLPIADRLKHKIRFTRLTFLKRQTTD